MVILACYVMFICLFIWLFIRIPISYGIAAINILK